MDKYGQNFNIGFYKSGNRCPVDEFIGSKNITGRAKIGFCFDLLMEKGHLLKRPYAAYLRDKIWELRPGINTEEYRLFYFWHEKNAVFVHAVDKRDFRQSDIDIAVRRMKEMLPYIE